VGIVTVFLHVRVADLVHLMLALEFNSILNPPRSVLNATLFIQETSCIFQFSLYFSGNCIPINPKLSYYWHHLTLAQTVI
jgi:hypothetical protein